MLKILFFEIPFNKSKIIICKFKYPELYLLNRITSKSSVLIHLNLTMLLVKRIFFSLISGFTTKTPLAPLYLICIADANWPLFIESQISFIKE